MIKEVAEDKNEIKKEIITVISLNFLDLLPDRGMIIACQSKEFKLKKMKNH